MVTADGREEDGYSVEGIEGPIAVADLPGPCMHDEDVSVLWNSDTVIDVLANDHAGAHRFDKTSLLVEPDTPGTTTVEHGRVRYRPDRGFIGEDHFDYEVCRTDGVCAVATAVVHVAPPCTITGTEHRDVLYGTPGPDVICGLGGDDTLMGGDGNDILIGGPGNDNLDGGWGNDILVGGPGNDILDGGPGNDQLSGGPGQDAFRVDSPQDATDADESGHELVRRNY